MNRSLDSNQSQPPHDELLCACKSIMLKHQAHLVWYILVAAITCSKFKQHAQQNNGRMNDHQYSQTTSANSANSLKEHIEDDEMHAADRDAWTGVDTKKPPVRIDSVPVHFSREKDGTIREVCAQGRYDCSITSIHECDCSRKETLVAPFMYAQETMKESNVFCADSQRCSERLSTRAITFVY